MKKYLPLLSLASMLAGCTALEEGTVPDATRPAVESSGQVSLNPALRCRDVLQPALRQPNPEREQLPAIHELCQSQAAGGDPDAEYHLAVLHLGMLDWDPDAAIPLMQSAARQGVAEARYWLAWQYEEGPLLENDAKQALYWYIQAGEQEHRLAVQRLLEIYTAGGLGEAPDAQKATLYRARLAKCLQRQAGLAEVSEPVMSPPN